MKIFYAPLLAAACFLSLPAYAQTPVQQDSTKNTDVPTADRATREAQMHKKEMKKDHATKMKKSHKKSDQNGDMMKKDDTMQSPDTMKKQDGTPGK